MKTFKDLTEKDALIIIVEGYGNETLNTNYNFKKQEDNIIIIEFPDSKISFEFENEDISIIRNVNNFSVVGDVCLSCYTRAYKLGYTINLLESIIPITENIEKSFFISYFYIHNKNNLQGYGNHVIKASFFDLHSFTSIIKESTKFSHIVILNYKELTEKESLACFK